VPFFEFFLFFHKRVDNTSFFCLYSKILEMLQRNTQVWLRKIEQFSQINRSHQAIFAGFHAEIVPGNRQGFGPIVTQPAVI